VEALRSPGARLASEAQVPLEADQAAVQIPRAALELRVRARSAQGHSALVLTRRDSTRPHNTLRKKRREKFSYRANAGWSFGGCFGDPSRGCD
jgi:hypothetical protein